MENTVIDRLGNSYCSTTGFQLSDNKTISVISEVKEYY